MGCASSAPLVEKGKNLVEGVKETANETVAKGEKVVHDTTDTIKDGVSSGIDTVKDTVQSALNTAEDSVGSVAHKIGETFSFATSKTADNLESSIQETKNHLNSSKDDILATASDNAAEAVSEAETVIMSEADHAREAFQSGTSPFFETVHSLDDDVSNLEHTLKDLETKGLDTVDHVKDKAGELEESIHQTMDSTMKKGTEVLEDLESDTRDLLGETVETTEKKMEELHEVSKPVEEENRHVDKEEPAPTFWEAAADAILMKKTLKHLEPLHFGQERIFFPAPDKSDPDSSEKKSLRENDIVVENTDNEN